MLHSRFPVEPSLEGAGERRGKARPPRVRPRKKRASHKGRPKEARAEVAALRVTHPSLPVAMFPK